MKMTLFFVFLLITNAASAGPFWDCVKSISDMDNVKISETEANHFYGTLADVFTKKDAKSLKLLFPDSFNLNQNRKSKKITNEEDIRNNSRYIFSTKNISAITSTTDDNVVCKGNELGLGNGAIWLRLEKKRFSLISINLF